MPSIDSRPASVVGHGLVSGWTGLKASPASTMSAPAAVTSVRPPNSLDRAGDLDVVADHGVGVERGEPPDWKTKTPSEAPLALGSGPVPCVCR